MFEWLRSKISPRLILTFLLFLMISMGGLIFTVKRFILSGMSSSLEEMTIKLISGAMILLLVAIGVILLLLSSGFINHSDRLKERILRANERRLTSEALAENDIDEDDLEYEDLIPHGDIIQEDETGTLAHSYNKMVEALQKINEMEKKHSIELADANRQLQKEINERERAEKEIRHLSRQLISSNEDARRELARDLHDEFGQMLAALHLNAESLLKTMPENLKDQNKMIDDLITLIEQLGDKIRNISSELRPDLLDDLGLVPTLEWYIDEFVTKRKDIHVDFNSVGLKKRLSPDLELVLYRIFQECLNNVVKHAKAKTVNAMLAYSHPKVIFTIRDDGVGFDPSHRAEGIGLLGMKERVISVKGIIDIRSTIGKGTTIRVELPVSEGTKKEFVEDVDGLNGIGQNDLLGSERGTNV